ncbi:MAG TPA: rhodanese-like domain-containing protein, partial [Bauldia sp.]|nr:rhodanese-like domain-containing protein [Bauldia sp.]
GDSEAPPAPGSGGQFGAATAASAALDAGVNLRKALADLAAKDPASPLPHMLPPADIFTREVRARGIGPDDRVVAFDGEGFAGAARCWWMFRIFGHDAVRVLAGGLAALAASGQPLAVADAPLVPG